jgi:cbb3-type cytochrome oxidase subunit 3
MSKEKQTFENHVRYIPLWHYVTGSAIFLLFVGSLVNVYSSIKAGAGLYSATLIVLISLILMVIFWYARWFALRAQDRAIRAEENLRHFILTGKPLDKRLRTTQILALRFAPDNEFVELAAKAANDKLRSKSIKKMIRSWKSDHHRV